MENETCECAEHGKRSITFVCKHIIGTPRPETAGFVSYPSDGQDDLRDAWCDDCNAYLQANGGEWVEGRIAVPDGIDILCADCYRLREEDAVRAGRRMILQG